LSEVSQFTIILSWPPRALSPNAGCRFGLKLKHKVLYRDECVVRIHNVWVDSACKQKPRWKKACYRIRALCGKKHQRGGKLNRPDEDNLLASLKQAFDALEIVGIINNDKHLQIAAGEHGAIEFVRTDAKESVIELVVWKHVPAEKTPTERENHESLSCESRRQNHD
jgi:hypothetical protein